MKYAIVGVLMLFSFNTFAQEALVWETNIKKAVDISIKEKKPLFLFFTGSDWCGVCKKLQQEVFAYPQFQEFSKNVVLVELDFPHNREPDPELLKQNTPMKDMFGITGFPTCVFVTPSIINDQIYYTKIGNIGYKPGGPDLWVAEASKFLPV